MKEITEKLAESKKTKQRAEAAQEDKTRTGKEAQGMEEAEGTADDDPVFVVGASEQRNSTPVFQKSGGCTEDTGSESKVAPRQSMQNTSEGRAAEAKKLTRQEEREANKVLMNKATAHSEPLGRIETLELEITFTVAQVAKLKAAIASLEAE